MGETVDELVGKGEVVDESEETEVIVAESITVGEMLFEIVGFILIP